MNEYTRFYSFSEYPFKVNPDARFFFLSESNREALAGIIYGIRERKGFILVSGEAGSGKTSLIQYLSKNLEGQMPVVVIDRPNIPIKQVLTKILLQLGVAPNSQEKTSLINQLNKYLIEKTILDENLAIFIDEAHTLNQETIEELRLLSNFETTRSKLYQIVLVGRPEIERKLNSKDLRPFRQRIVIRSKITRLTEEESKQYIDHHLELVGSRSSAVFTPGAISLICRQAKGIPRSINSICDRAFSIGYQRSRKRIDSPIVREALSRVYERRKRFSGVWAFGERLVTREVPRAVREAFSRVYQQRKRFSGVWAFGERLVIREIPCAIRQAFSRVYQQGERFSGVWAFGERSVIREIPCALRQAFSRAYEERKRFSGVWALRGIFLSKRIPYFAPVIICLAIGIFLGKEHIKIISGKTVSHLILAQMEMAPIIEREIGEPARNSRAPALEKKEAKPLAKQLIVTEKVPAPASERNRNISTRNSRPQDLERTKPMTGRLSAAKKVTAPMVERKIEAASLNTPTSAFGEIDSRSLPDPLIATRKEEPQKLGVKKVSQEVPAIIYSFASKQIRPGDIWKVYLKASDPNGGMRYILSIIEGAGSHLSIIGIKEQNREHFSGYIYLNTYGMNNSPSFLPLTLTIWIKDAAGHLSQPVIFPLELHNNIIQGEPPPGLFKEQDLGPIMVQIQSLTDMGG